MSHLVTIVLIGLAARDHAAETPSEWLPPSMVRAAIERGIDAFESGEAERASTILVDAADRSNDPALGALADLNAGRALLETDSFDLAADRFRRADRRAPDPTVRRDARFMLAHALLEQAPPPILPGMPGQDAATIDDRVEALTRAEQAFRSCLDVAPGDLEAAQNTERLRREIRELRDLQDMIEQQQQQSAQSADNLAGLANEQQEQAESNASDAPPDQQDGSDAQQGLSDRTDGAIEQLAEQAQQARDQGQTELAEQLEEAVARAQEARQAQQQAQQELDAGNPLGASEQQQRAADNLREAARAAEQANESMQPSESDSQPSDESPQDPSADGDPSDEPQDPGDQLADRLIDREEQQRQAREQRRSRIARPVYVERDW